MLKEVKFWDQNRGIEVRAYTDGYAYDVYECLYLISLVGMDSAVKAVSSALVTGRSVEVRAQKPIKLWAPCQEKFRILSTKLPSGLHQIVVSEAFFASTETERILYISAEEDIRELIYHHIKAHLAVPLIMEWKDWLCEQMKEEGWLEELLGTVKAVRLRVNEKQLDTLISEGVKAGQLIF